MLFVVYRAFGIVSEVTDKTTGQKFACKAISKARLSSAEDVDDIRKEMQVRRAVLIRLFITMVLCTWEYSMHACIHWSVCQLLLLSQHVCLSMR